MDTITSCSAANPAGSAPSSFLKLLLLSLPGAFHVRVSQKEGLGDLAPLKLCLISTDGPSGAMGSLWLWECQSFGKRLPAELGRNSVECGKTHNQNHISCGVRSRKNPPLGRSGDTCVGAPEVGGIWGRLRCFPGRILGRAEVFHPLKSWKIGFSWGSGFILQGLENEECPGECGFTPKMLENVECPSSWGHWVATGAERCHLQCLRDSSELNGILKIFQNFFERFRGL